MCWAARSLLPGTQTTDLQNIIYGSYAHRPRPGLGRMAFFGWGTWPNGLFLGGYSGTIDFLVLGQLLEARQRLGWL